MHHVYSIYGNLVNIDYTKIIPGKLKKFLFQQNALLKMFTYNSELFVQLCIEDSPKAR